MTGAGFLAFCATVGACTHTTRGGPVSYPFVPAANFTPVSHRNIDLIVVHDMEAVEASGTAEAVARFFQRPTVKASAHYCVDDDSVVQCVRDHDVAWAAPGANHNGLHIEHAGFARQTRDQWLDRFGRRMLNRSAKLAAEKAAKYGIPLRRVGVTALVTGGRGARGLTGHWDVTQAFHQSTHTDPGPNFPWDYWVARVRYHAGAVSTADVQAAADRDPMRTTGLHPRQTRKVQKALGMRLRSGRWRKGTRDRYVARYPKTGGRPTEATLRDLAAGAFPVTD